MKAKLKAQRLTSNSTLINAHLVACNNHSKAYLDNKSSLSADKQYKHIDLLITRGLYMMPIAKSIPGLFPSTTPKMNKSNNNNNTKSTSQNNKLQVSITSQRKQQEQLETKRRIAAANKREAARQKQIKSNKKKGGRDEGRDDISHAAHSNKPLAPSDTVCIAEDDMSAASSFVTTTSSQLLVTQNMNLTPREDQDDSLLDTGTTHQSKSQQDVTKRKESKQKSTSMLCAFRCSSCGP